ncbi:hypothetical protein [Deinococcus frigens]|uniref:hypothetical protein n=1 Tax=Deinococcus frigens TaxID=249403 RepID=UPI0012EC6515|nr:hypothetical protein [Deinococcus frigens]
MPEVLRRADSMLPGLAIWFAIPHAAPTGEPPVMLAYFEADPDTSEGAAALAALGIKRWTQPKPNIIN